MTNNNYSIKHRPRRLRSSAPIRDLVAENNLTINDFVFPLFVEDSKTKKQEIKSLPDLYRYNINGLLNEIEECKNLGINSFAIFPKIKQSLKDSLASEGTKKNNFYCQTISKVKSLFPETIIFSDVAMDPYSSDGHDGIVEDGKINNDKTLTILSKMALAQAQAGSDFICPSDMMDGRIDAIRKCLDQNNFTETSILSYTAKYASAFYGPFRDALDSEPKSGDKKTYQMDPRNSKEAIREAKLDINEGADIIMVKPATLYLDIIKKISDQSPIPVAAYNVSGEYSLIKLGAKNGLFDEIAARDEMLMSIKRAGAEIIFTYFAKQWAKDN